jgi:hypothetical protein
MYKVEAGDIITTNLVSNSDFNIGDTLSPGTNGILQKVNAGTQSILFKVASVTTTPDLQPALKLQCITAG